MNHLFLCSKFRSLQILSSLPPNTMQTLVASPITATSHLSQTSIISYLDGGGRTLTDFLSLSSKAQAIPLNHKSQKGRLGSEFLTDFLSHQKSKSTGSPGFSGFMVHSWSSYLFCSLALLWFFSTEDYFPFLKHANTLLPQDHCICLLCLKGL